MKYIFNGMVVAGGALLSTVIDDPLECIIGLISFSLIYWGCVFRVELMHRIKEDVKDKPSWDLSKHTVSQYYTQDNHNSIHTVKLSWWCRFKRRLVLRKCRKILKKYEVEQTEENNR